MVILETEREKLAPIHWFTPSMPAMARLTLGAKNSIRVLHMATGTASLKPSPLPPRVPAGTKPESGARARQQTQTLQCGAWGHLTSLPRSLTTWLNTHPHNILIPLSMNLLRSHHIENVHPSCIQSKTQSHIITKSMESSLTARARTYTQ